ncbi:cell wall-binding repeat-containing protein [Clostridium sp. DSM 100503]|uniref:cell wall-binding repeat-containing protein n=1 Tax=Clostridium sp. DSM 100503 TaxID=2963282 RepID=UPI00214A1D15|nr:cell wall-binding repeat-containing protein [Clostridium sp. DSM 100503]MCR1951916.1 cell wall-binding repeat-containing protein [Clostridium sp. DSM 100503]
MKKIISTIIALLLLIPSMKPLADSKAENDNIYNYMIENGTSLGVDNINDDLDSSNTSLMSNGSTKTIKNIVVIIRFKGEGEFINAEKSNQLNDSYNNFIDSNNDKVSDPGSISLNSYINDLTYGEININSDFYPKGEGTYLSIEAPETREYYEKYIAGSKEEQAFIRWAFDSVKNNINVPANELDKNGDGEIDVVTFLCTGATVSNNMLWPHETKYLGDSSLNGKKLGNYNLINIGTNENNIFNKSLLKVAIHEFLHVFNYPDLYRYYYRGNPVGEWDVMANTDGYGQLPLVYTRNLYSNLNLNIGEIKSDGTYTVKSSQSSNKNDVVAFKIKSPLSEKEYFMVEFRKQSGNWDSTLPGSGLIVYRINEDVDPYLGNRNGYPDHIYVFRDGDINSTYASGNTRTSFFSQESGRISIGNNDLISGFVSNSLYFNNGQNSGIVISEVGSANGDEINFKVTFPKENNEVKFTSIIGHDRYDTAAMLSSSNFTSSDTVVIVNGLELADGLAVTPLATYLKIPILLVQNNNIPTETMNEITRLGTKKVIIAGGEGVVSKNIQEQLNKLGINNIIRLGGKNRYETSLEIAKYIDSNCYDIENILLANGYAEADAMSIAAVAGRDRIPIMLTEANSLTSNSYDWLKNESLNNAYIIGGNGVISDKLLNDINSITALDIRGNRLGGKDRYKTNAAVIDKFYGNEITKIYASKGLELIDALSVGPIVAINNGAIVLCDTNLDIDQKIAIKKRKSKEIMQIGGGVSINYINSLKDVLK